jgi:hypothetical protein
MEGQSRCNRTGQRHHWTGTLTANTTLSFTFTAMHTGEWSDVITNTAYLSGRCKPRVRQQHSACRAGRLTP